MSELGVEIGLAFPGFTLEVNHSFAASGVTALFGQSGSGKTTLLRIIAGFERAARGRVGFDGEAWQEGKLFVPPHRRGVGTVFQEARLFPHLTVAGNLKYSERRAPGGTKPIAKDDVVEALDLGPLMGRRTGGLSGGERQRVAIGRALLTQPRLLLMDEPLASLDAGRKGEILAYIERLPGGFGVPILYVTHSLDEVIRLADRMVVLSGGRVRAAGGVAEVLGRLDLQADLGRFEAGAVLEGEIAGHDAAFRLMRVAIEGQTIEVPEMAPTANGRIRLHVRARDVALAVRRPEGISIRNVLEGEIVEVAEDGATAYAEVLMRVGGQRLRSRITRAAAAELGVAPGRRMFALIKSIAIDPSHPRHTLPRSASGEAQTP